MSGFLAYGFKHVNQAIRCRAHDIVIHLSVKSLPWVVLPWMVFFLWNASSLHARNIHTTQNHPEHLLLHLLETLDPDDFENEAAFEEYVTGLLDVFPVELNRAGVDELLMIPGLTERMARAIVEYRKEELFHSTDDLLHVPGIGPVTLKRIQSWITVDSPGIRQSLLSSDISIQQLFRYQQAFPEAAGYTGNTEEPARYPGSPARIYHRQTLTGTRFSGNLTQVKLPGEPMDRVTDFDFTSAHLSVGPFGPLRRLVIGDYSLRFGQGLVIWNTSSFGKGGAAHNAPYRRQQGITPYRSSGQIRFFRGVASEVAVPVPLLQQHHETLFSVSAFYSNRNRSAVEVDGDTIRPPTSNPYHRTEAERFRRHNSREMVYGGNVRLKNDRWHLGVTYASYRMNRPVIPHPQSSPLQGSHNAALGSDYSLKIHNVKLFGEYAVRLSESSRSGMVQKKQSAWIAGLRGTHTESVDWIFSIRTYHPGYWSEYGNGFGEGVGVPVNQSGWYFGFRIRPFQQFIVQGFIDRFLFPEPRRGLTRTSSGWEPMLQLQYRHNKDREYQIRIRYKERSTEQEMLDAHFRTYRTADMEYRLSARLQVNHQINDRLFLRTQYDRIFFDRYSGTLKKGMAVSLVVRWQATRHLRFDMCRSLFETDDFSSRLYLFEHDLTYAMASRMVYGVGQRSYLVMRYRPASWIRIEAKYSILQYFDRPATGSGHDLRTGPQRSFAGFQFLFRY